MAPRNQSTGKTPSVMKTFRVRGQGLCKEIVDGLINHRQWFTFRPLTDTAYPHDEYEFVLDAQTPKSGYGFTPTRNRAEYESKQNYGLELD
jgi:hypothetical protein